MSGAVTYRDNESTDEMTVLRVLGVGFLFMLVYLRMYLYQLLTKGYEQHLK